MICIQSGRIGAPNRPRRRRLLAALLGAPMIVGAVSALPLSAARAQDSWTGGTSNDWTTSTNWDTNTVPTAGSDPTIQTLTNAPVITTAVTVVSLTIGNAASGALTVQAGGSLTTSAGLILGRNSGGDGSLTVTGSSTTVTIGGGNALIGTGAGGTANLVVSNGATMTMGASVSTQLGSGSGTGTATVSGSGSTWNVNGTTFNFGATSGTATITLTDGGVLSRNGGALGLAFGNGTATLNIGAASGQAAAAAGTLNASGITFGGANNTVVFNHTDSNYTFSQAFGGAGAAQVKHEAGTTTLTGTSTNTNMTTAMSGGTLLVNGTLTGTTTATGGVLGGTGTLGTLVVNSGGVVNPGNGGSNVGTLTTTGNATFNNGSKLKIDGSGSTLDRLTVGGTLTINSGATLELSPAIGFTSGSYTVASATSITGTFDTTTVSGSSGATANVTYNATTITAALQAASSGNLPGSAGSAGGRAAGAVLDSLRGNAQMNNLIAVLDGLSSEQKATALNGLSGQQVAAMNAPVDAAGNVMSSVMSHAGVAGAGSPVASAGQQRSGVSTGERPELRGLWLNGIGGFGSTDAKNGTAGTNTNHGGMAGGVDFPLLEDRLTLGVVGGYVGSRTDIDNNGGNAESEAGFVGLYGRYELDNGIRLDGTAMAGYHSGEHDRRIQLGTASQTAHGDYDGYSTGGSLQVSKGFDVNQNTAVRPFAGVTAQRYWQDGYTETGAGTANLKYDDMTSDSVVSRVGAAVEFDTVIADHRVLPTVSLGWAHTFSDATQMDAAFALAPGSRFTTQGAQMDRDALEVGVSAEVLGKDNGFSVIAGYGGSFASDAQDHSFSLRAKMAF